MQHFFIILHPQRKSRVFNRAQCRGKHRKMTSERR